MNKAYKPTVWADEDTITADRLNKMELGIHDMYENVNEPLIVTFNSDYTGNKTWDEVKNAYLNGRTVLLDITNLYHGTECICSLEGYSYDGMHYSLRIPHNSGVKVYTSDNNTLLGTGGLS